MSFFNFDDEVPKEGFLSFDADLPAAGAASSANQYETVEVKQGGLEERVGGAEADRDLVMDFCMPTSETLPHRFGRLWLQRKE